MSRWGQSQNKMCSCLMSTYNLWNIFYHYHNSNRSGKLLKKIGKGLRIIDKHCHIFQQHCYKIKQKQERNYPTQRLSICILQIFANFLETESLNIFPTDTNYVSVRIKENQRRCDTFYKFPLKKLCFLDKLNILKLVS